MYIYKCTGFGFLIHRVELKAEELGINPEGEIT